MSPEVWNRFCSRLLIHTPSFTAARLLSARLSVHLLLIQSYVVINYHISIRMLTLRIVGTHLGFCREDLFVGDDRAGQLSAELTSSSQASETRTLRLRLRSC